MNALYKNHLHTLLLALTLLGTCQKMLSTSPITEKPSDDLMALKITPHPKIFKLFESITVQDSKIITKPGAYFLEHGSAQYFVVEYREPFIDLNALDQTILAIPFILNAAPLVFASGKTFYVDVMDLDLYYTLGHIQKTLQLFFPENNWNGTILAKNVKKNYPCQSHLNQTALFFSAGLDATTSALNQLDNNPLLITVWGRDIPVSQTEMWNNVEKQARSFTHSYGGKNAFIRSNFSTALQRVEGHLANPNLLWWSYTTQAIGLAGIAIPLVYAQGISNLLFASSHTKDYPYPYGTHPLLDNLVKAAGIQLHHDLPDLNRLEKLDLINALCTEKNLKKPTLRVCWGRDPEGGNCQHCDKCLRTMNEIVACGYNLKDFGFTLSLKNLALLTRVLFTKNRDLKANQLWHWQCITQAFQTRKRKPRSTMEEKYTQWLCNLTLEEFLKTDKDQYFQWLDKKDYYQSLWDAGL